MDPINTYSNTTEPQSTPDTQAQGAGDSSGLSPNSGTGINPEVNPQASGESKSTDNTEYSATDIPSAEAKLAIEIPPQEAKIQEILPTALPSINNLSAVQITNILKGDEQHQKSLMINLLKKHEEELVETAPVPQDPAATPPALPKHSKKLLITGVIVAIAIAISASAYVYIVSSRNSSVAIDSTPKPTITPAPSESPSPTPTPTPEVTPIQTSTPATVTAPTTTPTTDHPQMVTVQAKSGLWLRNSPTSVNQSNVIGWMPNNAQVSVDQIGVFWWHGTYAGKTGYFASKYTQ
jgi:hypothetical protein